MGLEIGRPRFHWTQEKGEFKTLFSLLRPFVHKKKKDVYLGQTVEGCRSPGEIWVLRQEELVGKRKQKNVLKKFVQIAEKGAWVTPKPLRQAVIF